MIELQHLSGMRTGEVVAMRSINIDATGKVWTYIPETHKTEHQGKRRQIHFGPKAQTILRPWLRTEVDAYLFSPAEATAERLANLRLRGTGLTIRVFLQAPCWGATRPARAGPVFMVRGRRR
jgi:integrase